MTPRALRSLGLVAFFEPGSMIASAFQGSESCLTEPRTWELPRTSGVKSRRQHHLSEMTGLRVDTSAAEPVQRSISARTPRSFGIRIFGRCIASTYRSWLIEEYPEFAWMSMLLKAIGHSVFTTYRGSTKERTRDPATAATV
ncbi:hypothetical protein F5146DRAFT_1003804 [Armillaria mellea]|nr:hypothetical protein F5146DRAFT_1003804 [Armillaria mellea]